jgi:hypothetical protein
MNTRAFALWAKPSPLTCRLGARLVSEAYLPKVSGVSQLYFLYLKINLSMIKVRFGLLFRSKMDILIT